MHFPLSNCIALGVRDAEVAAAHYERVLGWERGETGGNWIEMKSGPFLLYLVSDEVEEPTFELLTDDAAKAMEALALEGWQRVELGNEKEIYARDPFGYLYCLGKR